MRPEPVQDLFLNDHFLTQLNFIPTRCDRVLDLVITNVPDLVRVHEVLSPKESDVFTDHGTVSFEFYASTKATHRIKRTVLLLFNKSLRLSIFPEDWKLGNMAPIFTKGKRDFVEIYPRISLLPVISKVLERCVLAGQRNHISHLISREQHGFLAGRSCVTQLTSVLHYTHGQLDAGKQIDIIYLDMSKAFGKGGHTKLLGRLHQYGITGKLHDWFRSYLQGRKQQVTVLGTISRELPVTSRVPQGSLLGPILFLLFVDDLSNAVQTSRVACYADDTKIFKSIDSITSITPRNLTLTIFSVGPNHPGSCFISPSVNTSASPAKNHLYNLSIQSTKRLWNLATQRKTLVCGCQAILPRTNKYMNSVQKPTNSSDLCTEFLGTSKAPKRVVHCTFVSSGAISATQPKYGRHSPLAY